MTLLILRALDGDGPCCKRFRADRTVDTYGRALTWEPTELVGEGLTWLAGVLTQRGGERDTIVVRAAERTPGKSPIYRRMLGDGHLVDADRPWICGDIDDLHVPDELRAEAYDGGGWNGRYIPLVADAAVAYELLRPKLLLVPDP